MAENDPDKLRGPGGLTLRQVHEQVRKSVERDREAQKMRNSLEPVAAVRALCVGSQAGVRAHSASEPRI